ncbi:MAG TPA: RNA 2'-phosphotransferase [Prosthecobacter sp.]
MNSQETVRSSKFLSLVLRHEPHQAGLTLDAAGWTPVQALLQGCAAAGHALTLEQLQYIVTTNAKKRFEFSPDATLIRASQGHSVEVELDYQPQVPPAVLYHGTATRFLDAIREKGLLKMKRHHVHLSAETRVTLEVGARHGVPVLLSLDAATMHAQGHVFFRSTNGVWLTDHVPPEHIQFP